MPFSPKPLTDQQPTLTSPSRKAVTEANIAAILNFIRDFDAAKGYAPTLREIGKGVGIPSVSTVAKYLTLLQDEGRVTWQPNKARTIALTTAAPSVPATLQ